MAAGHSLGEFTALAVAGVFDWKAGLELVRIRAEAMQHACDVTPSGMAAVLGMDDALVEQICRQLDDIVVPANYNSPGQLVISGSLDGIRQAVELLKEKGAKRALPLNVAGAFHSPLMAPAREALEKAIRATTFKKPAFPVYQNVTAKALKDPGQIREQLIFQLTEPVRWTQSIRQMKADGAAEFIEIGPGQVLSGLVKKILA